MTRTKSAWFYLTVCACFRAVSASGSEPVAPTLTLRWCDPHGLFSTGSQEVGRQVSRIFEELDVALRWEEEAPAEDDRARDDRSIRIVMVRSDPRDWRLPSRAMGAVLRPEDPGSQVYIFFDGVVRALGYRPDTLRKRWPTAREKRELSRALARVIFHEVMHVVLPLRDHADAGLTRWKLDRESLIGPGTKVESSVAKAFRAALRL